MLWNAKNGSVTLGNTEMSYVSFGQGERAFVILPGLSDGLLTVRGKALMLAKPYQAFFDKFTVYMFSRKDQMPEGYTIRDMAEDQAKALETLGIREADIMGVSQGGMIAQYLAIDHPELMEKLVLAVTAPKVNDTVRARIGAWTAYAKAGDHRQLMIDTAENSYSEKFLKKYRRAYPLLGGLGKPGSYDRFLVNAEAILSFDAVSELNGILCPTLIIGGAEDRIVGVQASYELKEGIADSELYVYEGLGHAAYEEADDFYRRVFRFLDADRNCPL
jgi:pimeloyl-ACP methyl ester carboxylesterase